ncbi:DUF3298 domain-containing protein [Pseudogracilibacillus sp. SE30717A]|uniref:DUF3298 and DUF4163 domain-containing protein n=1 Tax=Pseudogracilibacillus sp. SE30717A TaxID=3098293 RepID=UPI00300DFDE5
MYSITVPVVIKTGLIHQQEMTLYYPRLYSLQNGYVQHIINQEIFNVINNLVKLQYQEQNTTNFAEMLGTFELKTNERNIVSIAFSNYAIFPYAAHGLTLMKSLTVDTLTGASYQLNNLFKKNSNYVEVLSKKIAEQIAERNITTLEPFISIRPDQDFYIADKSLVIYFQQYELAAYVYGLPMFPISVFELEGIITEEGPLGRMATNS